MHRSTRAPHRWKSVLLALSLAAGLAGCTAYHRAVQSGEKALAAGNWEEAVASYESALALDGRGDEARRGLAQARRGWAVALVEQGQAAQQSGALEEAAELFTRAGRVDQDNLDAPRLLAEVFAARTGLGDAALTRDALGEAEAHYRAVLARSPGYTRARLGLDRVKAAWARRFFAQADGYEKAGKLGNALVEYLRADEERPGVTPARERAARIRERLRDELALWVLITPVEDKAKSPEVAQRLQAGRVAAVLPAVLPIRVVGEAPADGKAGVRLDLTLERVWDVKDVQVSQASQTYLAGMRSVPNPERGQGEAHLLSLQRDGEDREASVSRQVRRFLEASAQVAQALRAAEACRTRAQRDCEEAFARCATKAVEPEVTEPAVAEACRATPCQDACGAEARNLEQARSDSEALRHQLEAAQNGLESSRRQTQRTRDAVLRLPLTVDEPMHAEHVYDVEKHRLAFHALVTTRMTELFAPGTPPTPLTREAVAHSEDTSHRGYEKYGVLVDPLVLRSEAELRNELGEKALQEVAGVIMSRYENHRARFVEDARRGQVRAGAEDVVETTVRALLLTAEAPPAALLEGLKLGRKLAQPLRIMADGG